MISYFFFDAFWKYKWFQKLHVNKRIIKAEKNETVNWNLKLFKVILIFLSVGFLLGFKDITSFSKNRYESFNRF